MIFSFLQGAYLGLSLVMPLGPLNVYIFNTSLRSRTLSRPLVAAFIAIICDVLLILTAIIGVEFISKLGWFKPILMFLGIIFLLVMAYKIWISSTDFEVSSSSTEQTLMGIIAYTAALSLVNPHALLDTFIVIGSVSSTFLGVEKHAFTIGCITSDSIWFLALTFFGFFFHKISSNKRIFSFINKASALVMLYVAYLLLKDLIIIYFT